MHHAAILNNYSHDLQVLHFTVEWGVFPWADTGQKQTPRTVDGSGVLGIPEHSGKRIVSDKTRVYPRAGGGTGLGCQRREGNCQCR